MQNYVDDSELGKILIEANQVMSGISGQKEMDSQQMLEMAKKIAAKTSSYTGTPSNPVTHFVERSARKVKSKIGMHIDMLKSTASNISQIKERIKEGATSADVRAKSNPDSVDIRLQFNPELDELGEYNKMIDETLKDLSTKTAGKTKIEEKIRKYRNIMGDVDGALKELPKSIKDGKVKKSKPIDHKLAQKVDIKAEEVRKKMQNSPSKKYDWAAEGYSTDEDGDGVGDWIKYEGFNCKEDLDRYNELFKEFTGEYPKEYEKRNLEEGYYEKDGLGRAIDLTKPGKQRRRGLFSPRVNEAMETEAMKKCKEMEKNLRDVLAKAMDGNGDADRSTVISERRFLEGYLDKKMDTIHPIDKVNNKETEKKKSTKMAGTKKNEEEEGRLCMDGPPKRGVKEDVEQKTPSSPARSSRKFMNPTPGLNISNEKKKIEVPRPKTSEELKNLEEHNINWDMDRIKKLIVKERQEQLRKKREAWERNNELSEEMIDREKLLALKKGLQRPSGPFDSFIPNDKPAPSDFITDRERHDKMYRNAVKGREGVYHKEDLKYEFGVNPFYYEPSKSKKEGGDSKDLPVSIRSYRGVRKRAET